MTNSFALKILFGLSAIIIIFFFSHKLFNKEKRTSVENEAIVEEKVSATNIIKDVSYSSNDAKGNKYVLNADEGQIDLNNDKVIFLTSVKATIIMSSGETINIQSRFGKYNIDNYDTIFRRGSVRTFIRCGCHTEFILFSR